jgi:hypothetical protein
MRHSVQLVNFCSSSIEFEAPVIRGADFFPQVNCRLVKKVNNKKKAVSENTVVSSVSVH